MTIKQWFKNRAAKKREQLIQSGYNYAAGKLLRNKGLSIDDLYTELHWEEQWNPFDEGKLDAIDEFRLQKTIADAEMTPTKQMENDLFVLTKLSLGTKTPFEIQSKSTRLNHAEGLILQLPPTHEGRNTWLLNYGVLMEAQALRFEKGFPMDEVPLRNA